MFKFFYKYQKIFLIVIVAIVIVTFSFFGSYSAISEFRNKNFSDAKIKVLENKSVRKSDIKMLSFLLNLEDMERENSFLVKEILKTNIANLLFEKGSDQFIKDFKKRLEKIKDENLLKKDEKFSLSTFKMFKDFYINQKKEFYRKNNKNFERKENSFDFFGEKFLDAISLFILKTSFLAEKQGLVVKNFEVEKSIEKYFKYDLSKISQNKKSFDMWKRVLFCKKYLNTANSVFLDKESFNEAYRFYTKKLHVKRIELPSYFNVKSSFNNFLNLLSYMKICLKEMDLFSSFKEMEFIEKEHPEFIDYHFTLMIKKIGLKDLFSQIEEKELLKWQIDNWKVLCQNFKILKDKNNTEEKFSHLEKLDFIDRLNIDNFSKKKIIEKNKVFLENVLSEKKFEKMDISLNLSNMINVFDGVVNTEILSLLKEAKIGILDENSPLYTYSEDQKNFYRIKVLSKEKSIISFQKAMEDDYILQNFLEEEIKKISFEKDREKFFEKNDLAKIVFKEVFQKLDDNMKMAKDYPSVFFHLYMQQIQDKLKNDKTFDLKNNWNLQVTDQKILKNENISFLKDFENGNKISKIEENSYYFYQFIKEEKEEDISFDELKKIKENLVNEIKYNIAKDVLNV